MFPYREKVIEKESLENVLINAPNVTNVEWIFRKKEQFFSRLISFQVNGKSYRIEWWKNISYLQGECGLIIPFETLEISGTWPNRAKTNLQFYRNGEVAAVLPIEFYEGGKK